MTDREFWRTVKIHEKKQMQNNYMLSITNNSIISFMAKDFRPKSVSDYLGIDNGLILNKDGRNDLRRIVITYLERKGVKK